MFTKLSDCLKTGPPKTGRLSQTLLYKYKWSSLVIGLDFGLLGWPKLCLDFCVFRISDVRFFTLHPTLRSQSSLPQNLEQVWFLNGKLLLRFLNLLMVHFSNYLIACTVNVQNRETAKIQTFLVKTWIIFEIFIKRYSLVRISDFLGIWKWDTSELSEIQTTSDFNFTVCT